MSRLAIGVAAAVATTTGFAISADAYQQPDPKWHGYADILAFSGADGTVQRSDLFIPVLQGPDTLSYINLRNEIDEDGFAGVNVGLGLRHRIDEWIAGTYGFIDWQETDHSGKYRQMSLGVELLHQHWEIRFNGYLPEDQKNQDRDAGFTVNAAAQKIHYVVANGRRNLNGVDGEFGTLIAAFAAD